MRWFAMGYTVLLIVGVLICGLIAVLSEYGAYSTPGCNLYDSLLYAVRCQGFVGDSLIAVLANFAMLFVQLSVILVASPFTALLVIPLWLPVFYVLYLVVKRIRLMHRQRWPL